MKRLLIGLTFTLAAGSFGGAAYSLMIQSAPTRPGKRRRQSLRAMFRTPGELWPSCLPRRH